MHTINRLFTPGSITELVQSTIARFKQPDGHTRNHLPPHGADFCERSMSGSGQRAAAGKATILAAQSHSGGNSVKPARPEHGLTADMALKAGRSSPRPVLRLTVAGNAKAVSVLLLVGLLLASWPWAGATAEPLRILMLGDSLTAGYGLAPRDALPAQLERALRAHDIDVRMINAGVSGDTTAGGLARLDWALLDRPHAVIVALGANDALRALDPSVTRSNLDRLLGVLAKRGFPTLLAGMMAPRNLGRSYVERFDSIYPELAARHDAFLYPFLLEGVATVTTLNQTDGLHPNTQGVEVIVERILPSVLRLIRRVTTSNRSRQAQPPA